MVSVKELDNAVFSIIAENEINIYLNSENVIIDKSMRFRLNMIKGQLRKIQKIYKDYIVNDNKTANRAKSQLTKAIFAVANNPSGEVVVLMQEDEKLISIVDTIMFKYEEAIQKSKTIPNEVKTMLKKSCSYWYSFEKYILKGVR